MALPLASILQSSLNFFINGGFFMGVLLVLSIAALTVIILRARAVQEKSVLPPSLGNEIERLQPGDSLAPLQRLIKEYRSPLGRVLSTLLQHMNGPRTEAIEAVQTRARHEIARLESGLIVLEIATGIAPLLGLLGTLSGLVHIFGSIGNDPVAVARGIAQALNTTIAGLGVAVPCLVMFNYFQRRIEVMAIEMETQVSELLMKCYAKHQSPEASPELDA